MKEPWRRIRSQVVPSIAVIAVIASLCFSVGEGLRLTPFPFSALIPVEATNVLLDAKTLPETSLYKYGPLDVPAQSHNSNKRRAGDVACPPSGINREVPACPDSFSEHQPFDIASVLRVSRTYGRAPPFRS